MTDAQHRPGSVSPHAPDSSATTGGTPPVPRAPGVTAVALGLYVALLDLAIETFRSGSRVRWWVAGIVAAYLAISLALWRWGGAGSRRVGWSGRAIASFVILLGLLAVTV